MAIVFNILLFGTVCSLCSGASQFPAIYRAFRFRHAPCVYNRKTLSGWSGFVRLLFLLFLLSIFNALFVEKFYIRSRTVILHGIQTQTVSHLDFILLFCFASPALTRLLYACKCRLRVHSVYNFHSVLDASSGPFSALWIRRAWMDGWMYEWLFY